MTDLTPTPDDLALDLEMCPWAIRNGILNAVSVAEVAIRRARFAEQERDRLRDEVARLKARLAESETLFRRETEGGR